MMKKIKQIKSFIQRQSLQAYSAGFTLVEILVVVAIIGLLATIVMISLSGVGEKGNNARRIEDLRSVHTALISYYYKSTPYQFPKNGDADYKLIITGVTDLAPTYIQKMPDDPDPVDKGYIYRPFKSATVTSCDNLANLCKNFILCVDLEPSNATAQQVFCCNKDGCNKSNAEASKCSALTVAAGCPAPL